MIEFVSSRQVSASFASAWQVQVSATFSRPTPVSPVPANPDTDTVQLSHEALSTAESPDAGNNRPTGAASFPSGSASTGGDPVDTTPATTPSLSSSERRAAALLDALDANQDGTLTEKEFVHGARRLLRGSQVRGGDEHHEGHGVADSRAGGGHGAIRHLQHRLERAFGQIDVDGNGTLDKSELTAALAGATHGGQPAPATTASTATTQVSSAGQPQPQSPTREASVPQAEPDAPSTPAAVPALQHPAPDPLTVSISVMTVTFATVAMQKYQVVSRLAA